MPSWQSAQSIGTSEAQDRAGTQIAEQVNLALAGDPVPYAVNA
ncbi:hypothetical protein [Candidatus Poriferisodalis sp.]